MMTKTQVVKAMKAAGIEGEVRDFGKDWEVELAGADAVEAFNTNVRKTDGFRTNYGSWILRPEYIPDNVDFLSDFNNKASRHHY